MKKYIQIAVVLIMILVVIGLASGGAGWVSAFSGTAEPAENAQHVVLRDPVAFTTELSSIEITGSGSYTVGGICSIDVVYNLPSGLKDKVDVEVPTDYSSRLPFGYEGDLYLPGCHVQHFKNDQIVEQASTEDGNWKVCFAERPEVDLTIYYYKDEPFSNSPIWIELDTTHEDGLACASAVYTGEYAVGSKVDAELELQPPGAEDGEIPSGGTILPPPPQTSITESGTYSVGGVCTLIVLYRAPDHSDEIHVADSLRYDHDPVDDYDYSQHTPFPEDAGLLYLPGCHVVHYEAEEITHWEEAVDDGEWEICFAARPDKQMTIYYYLGDYTDQESDWQPLQTTVRDGMACAPAFQTGVYAPAGWSESD